MDKFDIEDVSTVRDRDMARAKDEKPKKTWFVRRLGRGMEMEFQCEEKEAYDLLYNDSTWKHRNFEFFGYSDGKTYQKVVKESIGIAKKLEPEIAALEVEFNKFRRAEENLLVNEGVDMDDMTDPVNAENVKKILRMRTIIDKIDVKLEAKKTEFRSVTGGVIKKAIAAEREVAVANWEQKRVWPGRVNIITPDANEHQRAKILAQIG